MAVTAWTDAQRLRAQELIHWLLSQRTDSGWPWDWVNSIAFHELVSLELKLGLAINAAMQVLSEMAKDGLTGATDFEHVFGDLRKRQAAALRRADTRWRFFLPFAVTVAPDLPARPRVRLVGKGLAVISASSVQHQLSEADRQRLTDRGRISILTGTPTAEAPPVYVAVSGEGATWEHAWEDAQPAFDTFRGLLEFVTNYRVPRQTFGPRLTPRRTVPHPPWMLARKPGTPAEWVYFLTDDAGTKGAYDSIEKPFELTRAWHRALLRNSTFLRDVPGEGSTSSLIAACLRLYASAMDARFRHHCLLGFWQVAEALSRSESVGGQTDHVVARLAWHGKSLGLVGSGYEACLKRIADERNDVVHRGSGAVEDDDINILKLACETALVWLIRERASLPTVTHLDQFYRLRTANEAARSAMKDCLEYMAVARP